MAESAGHLIELGEMPTQEGQKAFFLRKEIVTMAHGMETVKDTLEKTLMLRQIKVKRRKGATEGEMVGWH